VQSISPLLTFLAQWRGLTRVKRIKIGDIEIEIPPRKISSSCGPGCAQPSMTPDERAVVEEVLRASSDERHGGARTTVSSTRR
jgi:hypothetical protein